MKLVEIINEKIDLQSDIQTASFFSEAEVVILTCEGEVLIYNYRSKEQKKLVETNPKHGPHYADGGFDPLSESSIYVMDDIIVVVNDYKKHGFVLNIKKKYNIHFSREDYHADISKYPIALFKDKRGTPFFIFGVAWNHVHITNLDTRQILTADKSLIIERAEQKHLEQKEYNLMFWPQEYDYFFGKLIMSPSREKFLSTGWTWGSFDYYNLYDVEDFISNHRITDTTVWMGADHNNRAVCFVDDNTVAIIFNPSLDEGNEDIYKENIYEIRLYHADGSGEKSKVVLEKRLDLNNSALFFCQSNQCFYTFSEKVGICVISRSGEIMLHEPTLVPQKFDELHKCFIRYDGRKLIVYKLEYSK